MGGEGGVVRGGVEEASGGRAWERMVVSCEGRVDGLLVRLLLLHVSIMWYLDLSDLL